MVSSPPCRKLAATLVVAVVLAPICTAQTGGTQPEPGIAVQLSTLTDRLLPMQPIRLIVRVTVVGDAPVRGAFILYPGAGRCGLVVDAQDGRRQVNMRETVLGAETYGDVLPGQAVTYEPGFEEVLDAVALYDPRAGEYLFPSPGRYDLQFWVQFFAGTGLDDYRPGNIKSNTVSLTVEEPEGMEQLASHVWWLPWGMPQESADDEVITGFVDDDDTSYSKYARFAMSGWSQISVGERIRILEVLAESTPPAQIHDLVLLRLAGLLFEEERFEECRRHAREVIDLPTAPAHSKKRAVELADKADWRLRG